MRFIGDYCQAFIQCYCAAGKSEGRKLLKPCHALAGGRANVVNRMDLSGTEIRMDARTEQPSVADEAYSRLRQDILGGELLPGMKLKLDALRERYEVSVNTLRETLSRLAADGLVEAEGQRGFAVMPASLADLIDFT